MVRRRDHPGAPEPEILIAQPAPRRVLRGRRGERHPAERRALPPVELDHVRRAERDEQRLHAERHEESRMVRVHETPHRVFVEMVVVIVRDDHRVNRRQVLEAQPGRNDPAWPRELHGARALAPVRIREDVEAIELHEGRSRESPLRRSGPPAAASRARAIRRSYGAPSGARARASDRHTPDRGCGSRARDGGPARAAAFARRRGAASPGGL